MSTFASDCENRKSPILVRSATGSVETQLRARRSASFCPTGGNMVDSGMP